MFVYVILNFCKRTKNECEAKSKKRCYAIFCCYQLINNRSSMFILSFWRTYHMNKEKTSLACLLLLHNTVCLLQLPRVRRCGRKVLHLGLEDYETVQEMEGARWRLHHVSLAPSRAQQAPHSRLGRRHQVLGLNKMTELHDTTFNFQPNMNHEPQ